MYGNCRERVVALYKQVLEIKKLTVDLKKQDVPDSDLEAIRKNAQGRVSPHLEELAQEMIEQYGEHLEKGRKNEVETELRHSLNKLANRIDMGFKVELRVKPPEEVSEENGEITDEQSARKEAIEQIMRSASRIEYLEHSGEPILFLPEKEDENDG